MLHTNIVLLATICLSLFSSSFALADVKVFQKNQTPFALSDDLQTSLYTNSGKFNKGLIAQQIVRYIAEHKHSFGLDEANAEILQLRRTQSDNTGSSLRFVQRHHRIHIEGAELIALLDSNGKLTTINSSLASTPRINTMPSISREQALQAAIAAMKLQNAEQCDDKNDGLLITISQTGDATLVWQFSLREADEIAKAAQIQIIANGPKAGETFKILNLGNSLVTKISIYDASYIPVIPNPIYKGVKVLRNGKKTLQGLPFISQEAKSAHDMFDKTTTYYFETFGRRSYDGNGAQIKASINTQRKGFLDLLGQKENAAWMGPWKMFTFGAGSDKLDGFASALDVVAHEFTHAVISSTSDLAYEKQSGALNEHLTDVFGEMIQQHYGQAKKPFLIGETVLRGEYAKKAEALRDMLNPEKGLSAQPASIAEIPEELGENCKPTNDNGNCGVHILSGIPNKAVALSIKILGWEKLNKLFYRVMTQRLLSKATFTEYKDQVLDECSMTLPATSCGVIDAAFAQVGI